MIGGHAHVVGSAFVGEERGGRERIVMREIFRVGENLFQQSGSLRRLQGAMKLGEQISRRHVKTPISTIGAGGNRGGVGGPHGRGAVNSGEQARMGFSLLNQFRRCACKTDAAKSIQIRPRVRRQHALLYAEIMQEFHFRQTLEGGLFRVGFGVGEFLGGDVAEGEAGVVVRGADEESRLSSKAADMSLN